MDYHKNARTTVWSREQMARQVIDGGWTLLAAAAANNVSAKTAAKWVVRYRQQGAGGLVDRSCRPRRLYRPTGPELVALVESLLRQRWTGLRIARQTGLSRATVSRILCQLKLSRMRDWPDPCFAHITEYDFRVQERGVAVPYRTDPGGNILLSRGHPKRFGVYLVSVSWKHGKARARFTRLWRLRLKERK